MTGTFPPPPPVSDPDMYHGVCVTHVPWCMPGSVTCGFLWNRWRGKCSRHSRRMHNPQFYISGNRPIIWTNAGILTHKHEYITWPRQEEKSPKPFIVYGRQCIRLSMYQVMAWCLLDTKSLFEQMLVCCQPDYKEKVQQNLNLNTRMFVY